MAFEAMQFLVLSAVISIVLMCFGFYSMLTAKRLNEETYKCMKTFNIFLEDACKEFEAMARDHERKVNVVITRQSEEIKGA